jgi:large subunit ribosomal protein L33
MPRELILMKSTGKTQKGKVTGTSRTTSKNKRTMTDKLEKKYYDRRAYCSKTGKIGIHVVFKEAKLPSSSK